jgi:hypothetical protein
VNCDPVQSSIVLWNAVWNAALCDGFDDRDLNDASYGRDRADYILDSMDAALHPSCRCSVIADLVEIIRVVDDKISRVLARHERPTDESRRLVDDAVAGAVDDCLKSLSVQL